MKKLSILFLASILAFASCKKDKDKEEDQNNPVPTVNTVTENITVNTTWTTASTYIIDGSLYIDGATLTIEPGAIIKFQSGARIYVGYNNTGSAIIANGTLEKPILFTSNASTPTAGDWDAILFEDGTASTTSLKFCTFNYGGGYSSSYGAIILEDCEITMENCTVTNSKDYGISIDEDASFKSFINNTINNCGTHVIKAYPSNVHTIGAGNVFTANASLGIYVQGGYYNHANETWLAQTVPYVISGSMYIENNAGSILNIQEGATIAFSGGARIYVGYSSSTYGTLKAIGTSEKPILFTSAAASKTAGDWDAILLDNGTSNNTKFEYCTFEYGGGYSSSYGMLILEDCNATINHCTFTNSDSYGITINDDSEFLSFDNNSFASCATYPIQVYAGNAHTIGTGNTYTTALGILVKGGYYNKSTATWKKQSCGYYISGSMYIESATGSELIIEAGNNIYFTSGSRIYIGYSSSTFGKLVAQGTAANRITFTTSAPAGSSSAGDWDAILFDGGTSAGSILDNCDIKYGGGYSSSYGMISIYDCGTNVTISNCDLSYSSAHGISYETSSSTPTLTNNTFSNIAGDDVHQY